MMTRFYIIEKKNHAMAMDRDFFRSVPSKKIVARQGGYQPASGYGRGVRKNCGGRNTNLEPYRGAIPDPGPACDC
jgi:hypothetical protein